jgi:ketosteroid isomerase-like protein
MNRAGRSRWVASLVLCLVVATTGAQVSAEPRAQAGPPSGSSDASAESVIAAFHAALKSQDAEAAYRLLLPELSVFEDGGAERSRREYFASHVKADMDYRRSADFTLLDRRIHQGADIAIVITEYRVKDPEAVLSNTETIVLRQTPSGWRIAHVHWSTRPEENSPAYEGSPTPSHKL